MAGNFEAAVEPASPGHWLRPPPAAGERGAEDCGSKPACAGLDSLKSHSLWL